MGIAEELLSLAGQLAAPSATDPEQAWLRRSVSTAYYAVFHLLVQEATLRWSGSPASQLGLERAFKHDLMKEASRAVANGTWAGWSTPPLAVSPELRIVARSFTTLQDARHQADYNNQKIWTRTEASARLDAAESAFQKWKEIRGTPVADEFLLSLMIGKRRD
jgi:uncharacterized protein (UPF0332 family)